MAFGNYYGGVTNDKNILDKLAEMTKELREVKGMLINPEVQAEQIKYQAINAAKAEADKLINEAKAEAEKIRNEAKEEVRKEREQRDKSEDERKKRLDTYLKTRQNCYKREVNMDVSQWLENYFAKEKRAAEIHDEMCANTNIVQATATVPAGNKVLPLPPEAVAVSFPLHVLSKHGQSQSGSSK